MPKILDSVIRSLTSRNLNDQSFKLSGANLEHFSRAHKRSRAGFNINEDNSLSVPAFFNGVRMISETVMKLPLLVYRQEADGSMVPAREHPAYTLLRHTPSPVLSADVFIQTMTALAIIHGNAFAYIKRNNAGVPKALYVLNPATVAVELNSFNRTSDGSFPDRELVYNLLTGPERKGGRYIQAAANDVLHIRGLSCNELGGKPLIEVLADALGASISKTRYTAVFFGNDASPNVVIRVPWVFDDADDLERFRQSWANRHQGVDRSSTTAILENGATVEPFGISPQEAQLVESGKFSIIELANVLGIPAELLNADVGTSYNSLEQKNRDFLNYGLGGWLSKWRSETQAKLLLPDELTRETHAIDFDRHELERADANTEAQAVNTMVNGGQMLLNEARRRMNLPSVPGGDVMRVPLNLGTINEDGTINNPNAKELTDGGVGDESGGGDSSPTPREAIDAYGIGVRAGVITPAIDDENHFRGMLGLPAVPSDVLEVWADEKTRRPITITPPPTEESAPAEPAVAPVSDDEPADAFPRALACKLQEAIESKTNDCLNKCAARIKKQAPRNCSTSSQFESWREQLLNRNLTAFVGELEPLFGDPAVEWARRELARLADELLELSGACTVSQLRDAVLQHIQAWAIDSVPRWQSELIEGFRNE